MELEGKETRAVIDLQVLFSPYTDMENGIKGVLRKCKTPLFESKNDRFI